MTPWGIIIVKSDSNSHVFLLFNCQVCLANPGYGLYDIGEQETAAFNINGTAGACVLSFKGQLYPGLQKM